MKKLFAAMVAAVCFTGTVNAQVLDFEGIGNSAAIGNFYNGGAGTNYGIEFFGNALGIQSRAQPCVGTGNFALQPSGCGIVYFFSDAGIQGLNRAAGFTTGFSLFYSAIGFPVSLGVFSGLNGTGSVLALLFLPPTSDGIGVTGMSYCPFVAAGIAFSGTAQSILLAGVANQIVFDNVTFGSSTPGTTVPEPSTYALMAAGLAALNFASRRRRVATI